MSALLLLNLIVPFVMVLAAWLTAKYPAPYPGTRNYRIGFRAGFPTQAGKAGFRSGNGYSTPTSLKSQAHWDYAQKAAPVHFIAVSKLLFPVELVLSAAFFLAKLNEGLAVGIGTAVGFIFMFYAFYRTEKDIKENFPAN